MGSKAAVFVAMTAALLLTAGCAQSPQGKATKLMAKGKKEYDEKRFGNAVLHFKSAVQVLPKEAEPYYQLGLAYLGAQDVRSAIVCFRKASELDPKHTGARLKIAELMANSSDRSAVLDAERQTEEILDLQPENVEALNVLAVAELRLGKTESAEAHLEQALQKAPADLRASLALAQTRLARKDPAGAETALKQAVEHAPKDPAPSVYLGNFYLGQNRASEAEQQFHRALQLDPKHAPALLALGAMQARAGQADQADKTYLQVSLLGDKHYRSAHALYLFQSGKREQALTEFEKLVSADPNDRDVRTQLTQAYLSLNRVADAERVVTAALKKNPRDVDALLQRSRIYLGSGKPNEALADLNNVLHFRSNSAEAHYLVAKARRARGELELQQQELGEALRMDPRFLAARLDLAQALTGNRGADTALKLLDETPAAQKNTLGVAVQRAWALITLGRKAEARKLIDEMLAAGSIPDALLQDAVLKINEKDYAGARASADSALKLSPQDTRALGVLLQTYAAQNQTGAGLKKVRDYAATQPGSARVQQFAGQVLLGGGDVAGSRQAFEAAKTANPVSPAADLSLASLELMEGRREEARKRLSGLMASHPDNLRGELMLGYLELTDNKPTAAIEHYRKALALDERNVEALNGLAYMLADAKQADEALKYAQRAKELAPDNSAIDDTIGWTYFQKGMYSLAVTHLQSAVSKESTAIRQYHLAMACVKAGDTNRGRQALQAGLKLNPKLPEAQTAQAMFESTK